MHIAACFGAVHVICLLHENGAALEPQNKKKRTPLQIAERVGEADSVRVLTSLLNGEKPVLNEGDGDDDDDDEDAGAAPAGTAAPQPTDAAPVTQAMEKLSTDEAGADAAGADTAKAA